MSGNWGCFTHQNDIFTSRLVGKPDFEINHLASDQVASYKVPFRLWTEEIADPGHAL
jgi:hypothetical protein